MHKIQRTLHNAIFELPLVEAKLCGLSCGENSFEAPYPVFCDFHGDFSVLPQPDGWNYDDDIQSVQQLPAVILAINPVIETSVGMNGPGVPKTSA